MKDKNTVLVIPRNCYAKNPGQFGIKLTNGIGWFFCREQFHRSINWRFWRRNFYFTNADGNHDNLIKFIDEVEVKLKLKNKTKILFTNIPNILYVKPSTFWRWQNMRYALLTILFRVGQVRLPDDTLQVALSKHIYSRYTLRAINHFLSGRTYYTGCGDSWFATFSVISCCAYAKCRHKDRSCRKKLDNLLVPPCQMGGIHHIMRLGRRLKGYLVNKIKD